MTFDQRVEKLALEVIYQTGSPKENLSRIRRIIAADLRKKEDRANRPLTSKPFAALLK